MPGSPMKRAMIAELERRAALESTDDSPVTAVDVVAEWVAGGGTMRALAEDLSERAGRPISFGILSAWANGTQEGKAALAAARAIYADNLVEEGQEILDDLAGTEVTREEINLAKARAEFRQWRASKYNRAAYGADQAQVNVAVNLPGLHLDALRLRAVTTPILPPAGPDVELVSGE